MTYMLSAEPSSFEGGFLDVLSRRFLVNSVRYALLGRHGHPSEKAGAGAADIVVHPEDLGAACAVVADIARTRRLCYDFRYSGEGTVQFRLVRRDKGGRLEVFTVDLFVRREVYGIEVLSAEEMLRGTRDDNGIAVVSDLALLLDKVIVHLLAGRQLQKVRDAEFASIAQVESPKLISRLSLFLPLEKAVTLANIVADGKESSMTLDKRTRRRALIKLWLAQGPSALSRSLHFLLSRLRNWFTPQGLFLSLSGPDGSGKTTIIDMVTAQLDEIYGVGSVKRAHFRPAVLPRIAEVAKFARAVETVDENYDRPHRARPSGRWGSAARLGYYWLDYVSGYLCHVRPVLWRRKIMLFDRYYYDMVADSFRSRIALPMPFLLFIGRMVPSPQYAFFIRVNPAEIHRRKQELTLERIVELNNRYEYLVRQGRLIPVENDGSAEDAAAAIVDHIVSDRHALAISGRK